MMATSSRRSDLGRLVLGNEDYGQELTNILFGSPAVLSAFKDACHGAQASEAILRVRLCVPETAEAAVKPSAIEFQPVALTA